MIIKALALVSTVFLLMTLGFSVLGTTPLLVLKHLQPMDSRVIRQVFHYCYTCVTVLAIAASVSNALEERPFLSICTGAMALWVFVLHRWMRLRMDALRVTMLEGDTDSVHRFRQLHIAGVCINIVLFSIAIGAVSQIKL